MEKDPTSLEEKPVHVSLLLNARQINNPWKKRDVWIGPGKSERNCGCFADGMKKI